MHWKLSRPRDGGREAEIGGRNSQKQVLLKCFILQNIIWWTLFLHRFICMLLRQKQLNPCAVVGFIFRFHLRYTSIEPLLARQIAWQLGFRLLAMFPLLHSSWYSWKLLFAINSGRCARIVRGRCAVEKLYLRLCACGVVSWHNASFLVARDNVVQLAFGFRSCQSDD